MRFRGRYYFLSNFYPCSIEIDGIRYESAEATFQGQKTQSGWASASPLTSVNGMHEG